MLTLLQPHDYISPPPPTSVAPCNNSDPNSRNGTLTLIIARLVVASLHSDLTSALAGPDPVQSSTSIGPSSMLAPNSASLQFLLPWTSSMGSSSSFCLELQTPLLEMCRRGR